jgi:hypothetical protein
MESSDSLQEALSKILESNFDQDSQACIVTLIKVIDNVIQKPNDPKVRSIRLSNPVVAEKIVSFGGVDYLVACGFVRQTTPPPLLAKTNVSEDCLVLETESTALLDKARRLLMTTAIHELHMKTDDLPKYKPPPARLSNTSAAAVAPAAQAASFNPYQGHRHNSTGQPQPQESYISPTETKLRQLKAKQDRLEAQLQGSGLQDRELVAFHPPQQATVVSSDAPPTSDGGLLAQRMQRLEQERLQREEGGFTTKAMRDLQKLKRTKVYSHAKVRIQFSDGSALEAKFLPKETLDVVKNLIDECLLVPLEFDLYVAPPRRQLDFAKSLQEEGLVPAAKVFCSWKGATPPATFLKQELFHSVASAYPTAKPLVQESKKQVDEDTKQVGGPAKKNPSREEAMLQRMMGGGKKK